MCEHKTQSPSNNSRCKHQPSNFHDIQPLSEVRSKYIDANFDENGSEEELCFMFAFDQAVTYLMKDAVHDPMASQLLLIEIVEFEIHSIPDL